MADQPKTTGANRLSPDYKKATGTNRLAGKVYPKSTTSKVLGVAKDLAKATLEPLATFVARPVQLGAEVLFGVSDEKVNEFTKKRFGDWIAPTPQNMEDLKKDIGRGIQVVATGGFGGTLRGVWQGGKLVKPVAAKAAGLLAGEGAAFGVGTSLEQGNDLLSKETAKQAAIGAGVGILAPVALKGVNRLLKGKQNKVISEAISKEAPLEAPVTAPKAPEPLGLPEPSKSIALPEEGVLAKEQSIRDSQAKIGVTPEPPQLPTEIPFKNPKRAAETSQAAKIMSEDAGNVRQYTKQTNEAQIEGISKMDQKLVLDIAMGRKPSPNQIPRDAYLAHLKNIADKMADAGDETLAMELSKSNVSSLSGQALQANKIAARDSLTNIIRDVRLKMTERIPKSERETKKLYDSLKTVLEKSRAEGVPKPTRQAIVDAVRSLKCP